MTSVVCFREMMPPSLSVSSRCFSHHSHPNSCAFVMLPCFIYDASGIIFWPVTFLSLFLSAFFPSFSTNMCAAFFLDIYLHGSAHKCTSIRTGKTSCFKMLVSSLPLALTLFCVCILNWILTSYLTVHTPLLQSGRMSGNEAAGDSQKWGN